MEPGDLVLSMSGGDLRKSDKPKKKKTKHVLRTGYKSEFIKQKFAEDIKVTNTELRTEINKFINSLNPSGKTMG